MATTIQVPIPESGTIYLTANCHAAWEQTLVYKTQDHQYTFVGQGEGINMKTTDGQTLVKMQCEETGGHLTLSFSSSGNPNPRVQSPVKHRNGTMVQYTVTSEDDVDDDNNDTYAMFWFNEGKPQRSSQSQSAALD